MTSRDLYILLLEGKGANSDSLVPALQKEWSVEVAHTGNEALEHTQGQPPTIIVYDASSMRSSGVRSCRRLRKQWPETPIVHVHSVEMKDKEEAQADVYLVKPFTPRKLINRIRTLLPADETEEQIVRAGSLTLYMGKRSIDINGKGEHQLTPKLALLLEEFLRHPNEILSRKQLMENVWQTSYVGDTRTLDVHIRWVREIIEERPTKPELLTTVRGIGYIFQVPEPTTAQA